ncbi:hypothetical protein, partial [Candidatus Binatus sp.]|uniref:hypothetical protein n=1 Tax=Candidatus Binatus sp. TaxID=2811406 RepID=UPI003C6EFD78
LYRQDAARLYARSGVTPRRNEPLFLLRESLPRRLPAHTQDFTDSRPGHLALAQSRDVLTKDIFGFVQQVGGRHQGLQQIAGAERIQSGERRDRFANDDVVAQFHAIIADKDGGPCDEFLELFVAFSAERAIEHLALDHNRLKPRVKDYLTSDVLSIEGLQRKSALRR